MTTVTGKPTLLKRTYADKVLDSVIKKAEKEAGMRKQSIASHYKKEWNNIDVSESVEINLMPTAVRSIREKYFAPLVQNPLNSEAMNAMDKARKEINAQKISEEIKEKQSLVITENLSQNIIDFIEKDTSHKKRLDKLSKGMNEHLKKNQQLLHGDEAWSDVLKKKPDLKDLKGKRYGQALASWVTEDAFRSAHISLREQQAKEVEDYVKQLADPAKAEIDSIIINSNINIPASDPAKENLMQKLRKEQATKLFAPIHEKEQEILENYIGASRTLFKTQNEHNLRWADICSRQSKEMYAAAKEQQEIRREAYEQAKDKVEEEYRNKESLKHSEDATLALSMIQYPPEIYEGLHEPDGNPTLDDFKAAVEVDRKRVPRKLVSKDKYGKEQETAFRYAKPGDAFGTGIAIKFDNNGGMTFKSKVPSSLAYKSQEVHDTMIFMSRTIMEDVVAKNLRDPINAKQPKILFHFGSVEYCKAAYRAALMEGFDPKNIRFDDKQGKTLTVQQKEEIQKEVGYFKKDLEKQQYVKKEDLDLPKINLETLENDLKDNKISIEAANEVINQYEKQRELLNNIQMVGKQYKHYLEKERVQPLTEEEKNQKYSVQIAFAESVDKLNNTIRSLPRNVSAIVAPDSLNVLGQKLTSSVDMMKTVDEIIQWSQEARDTIDTNVKKAKETIIKVEGPSTGLTR